MRQAHSETALVLLQTEWREYTEYREKPATEFRIIVGMHGAVDAGKIRRQSAVVRMVSVVEAFVDGLNRDYLVDAIARVGEKESVLISQLMVAHSVNWETRRSTLELFYSVEFGDAPAWGRLLGAIEARNTIVHGLGDVASSGGNFRRLQGRLEQVGIAIAGGALIIGDDELERVYRACVEFVRWTDESI